MLATIDDIQVHILMLIKVLLNKIVSREQNFVEKYLFRSFGFELV